MDNIRSVCRTLGSAYRIGRSTTSYIPPSTRAPLHDLPAEGSAANGTARRDSGHEDGNARILQEMSSTLERVAAVRAARSKSRSRSPRRAIDNILVERSSTSSITSTSDGTSSTSSSTSSTSTDSRPLTHLLLEKKRPWEDTVLCLEVDTKSIFVAFLNSFRGWLMTVR
eukprot:610078-Amphidinium_carterae.3